VRATAQPAASPAPAVVGTSFYASVVNRYTQSAVSPLPRLPVRTCDSDPYLNHRILASRGSLFFGRRMAALLGGA